MEDDRDILGKADALLRRHVPPRSSAADGADVTFFYRGNEAAAREGGRELRLLGGKAQVATQRDRQRHAGAFERPRNGCNRSHAHQLGRYAAHGKSHEAHQRLEPKLLCPCA